MKMPPLLEELRPRQWTKNLLLFVPLIFARRMGDPESILRATGAFAVFCLLSGAVYLLNDLKDLEQDRVHPLKSRRPLASGRVSRTQAIVAMVVVLALGLGGAFLLTPERVAGAGAGAGAGGGEASALTPAATHMAGKPSFLTCALAYLALLVAYSLELKHVVILDVMVIAMGFVLRAVAGAAAITVDISHWLLICTIFLSLFLALAKRRHEILLLAEDASSHRRTLGEYDAYLLDQMISVVAAACVISYALYTMAQETIAKFGTDRLNVTIPFVVYGLFRYLYLVHRRADGGDPSVSLVSDRPILIAVVLWGLTVIAVLYG